MTARDGVRRRGAVVGALVVLTGGLLPLAPAGAATAETPCAPGTPLTADADGDGTADLAVAGQLGTASATWSYRNGGSSPLRIDDERELVWADLNGDVCADAVLAPTSGLDHDDLTIALVPGTPDGLSLDDATSVEMPQDASADDWQVRTATLRHDGVSRVAVGLTQLLDQDVVGHVYLDVFTVDSSLEVVDTQAITVDAEDPAVDEDDLPIAALAADGRTIALGLPGLGGSGRERSGAVWLYTTDAGDDGSFHLRSRLTQQSPGVPGSAEVNDRFGASLALRDGRLAVGVPGEADGKLTGAGAVQPFLWNEGARTYTAYRQINQDTKGVPGSNEKGDNFGSHLVIARGLTASGSYDLLIGAQGENAGAGSVTVANISRSLYRTYTQATKGVPGSSEKGDRFTVPGVRAGANGVDTVLIGAPGEDAGTGYAIRSDGKKLTSATKWTTIARPTADGVVSGWGRRFGGPTS